MENNLQQLAEEAHQRILAENPSLCQDAQKLWDYLMYSEYELILYMQSNGLWPLIPGPPAGFTQGAGSIELGLIRYWAQNPWKLDWSGFDDEEIGIIVGLCFTVDGCAPYSQMDEKHASYFNNNELIYTDGSVLGAGKYACYDQGWFVAFLNLLQTFIEVEWYNGGIFPTVTPPTVTLSGASTNEVNIALVGDWGTGDATAQAVMKQLASMDPDYIIHVGDVYYSGSPSTNAYFSTGEESNNLVGGWPPGYVGKSFTLNSNHEMYCGANGYFNDALLPQGSIFSAQNGSSCWALQYNDWTILGLDSAFMGSTFDAFMVGNIGDPEGTQAQWIASLNLNPDKLIVLSHHNAFSEDGSTLSPLWAQVTGALNNNDPYAWYWGHAHYGIAYNCPVVIEGVRVVTYGRCLGHGALPYGPASGLAGAPVAWSCTHADPNIPTQLANGFAILTLKTNGEGQVTSIVENFYDISTKTAAWTMDLLE